VLCLSSGDFYGLGELRRAEFHRSCAAIGVAPERSQVVDDPQLQDGPESVWPPEVIASIVGGYVRANRIDVIVTFDEGGVSGHPNHCAIVGGTRLLLQENLQKQKDGAHDMGHVDCMVLETTCSMRKYLGIADIPYSWFLNRNLHTRLRQRENDLEMKFTGAGQSETRLLSTSTMHTCRPSDIVTSICALLAHQSQLAWYRILFVIFARYTYTNTLRPLLPVLEGIQRRPHFSCNNTAPIGSAHSEKKD
jgi:N-acetylglucosaminylphosphatidylinositol deacetylase